MLKRILVPWIQLLILVLPFTLLTLLIITPVKAFQVEASGTDYPVDSFMSFDLSAHSWIQYTKLEFQFIADNYLAPDSVLLNHNYNIKCVGVVGWTWISMIRTHLANEGCDYIHTPLQLQTSELELQLNYIPNLYPDHLIYGTNPNLDEETNLQSLVCNGSITFDANDSPECLTGWLNIPAPTAFNISQIQPDDAARMFAAGFAMFILPWASAFGFSQLLSIIKR